MIYEEPIILMGNKVRHLIDILNLAKATRLNCIAVNRDPFDCFAYQRTETFKEQEYRITKEDIKQIKLIYEITGDRETALLYLFKD